MTNTVAVQAAATSAQLKAEIAGSQYGSVKKLAVAMGQDYTTLSKWVAGSTKIKLEMLFRVLELIEVEPGEFFSRVQKRAERELAKG